MIQWILGGPVQRWQWSFSSWDSKICCMLRMNISWGDYYSLFFRCWGSTAVVLLVFDWLHERLSLCFLLLLQTTCSLNQKMTFVFVRGIKNIITGNVNLCSHIKTFFQVIFFTHFHNFMASYFWNKKFTGKK